MKIFISYRRKDSGRDIGRIRDRLMAEFGADSVFRDLVDIPAGVDFRAILERETNKCDVMLVVIGSTWASITDDKGNKRLDNPADFTRIEVETGLRRMSDGNTMVIPLLVSNASMPSPGDLPESLGLLHYQNAISVRDDPDFNHDMDRLIRDIRRARGYVLNDISIGYLEPETVQIMEGAFWMGSPAGSGFPSYESPLHEVWLPAFRIGRFPVTNAQFAEFVREKRRLVTPMMGWEGQNVPFGREKNPVSGVTWFEALAYCQWLSEKTGRNYSLPNEAQWEKACHGGMDCLYPWGNELKPDRSNHGCPGFAAVDAYPPQNEFGLYDLVGNVRQWTITLWGEKLVMPESRFVYPWKEDQRNDIKANGQIRRVVRGSSIKDAVTALRCSARSGQIPDDGGSPGMRHGFRVVINN